MLRKLRRGGALTIICFTTAIVPMATEVVVADMAVAAAIKSATIPPTWDRWSYCDITTGIDTYGKSKPFHHVDTSLPNKGVFKKGWPGDVSFSVGDVLPNRPYANTGTLAELAGALNRCARKGTTTTLAHEPENNGTWFRWGACRSIPEHTPCQVEPDIARKEFKIFRAALLPMLAPAIKRGAKFRFINSLNFGSHDVIGTPIRGSDPVTGKEVKLAEYGTKTVKSTPAKYFVPESDMIGVSLYHSTIADPKTKKIRNMTWPELQYSTWSNGQVPVVCKPMTAKCAAFPLGPESWKKYAALHHKALYFTEMGTRTIAARNGEQLWMAANGLNQRNAWLQGNGTPWVKYR
ncbi:hypothetical protein IPG36_05895 [bacterium]|nr:MAG: hypothetical protein IPG36_05895 [bacterium]